MFFCGGGNFGNHTMRMDMAISKDLWNWERYEKNPVFVDDWDARDPMTLLIKDPETQKDIYVMYYCLDHLGETQSPPVVAYRTSNDLINWSERKVAFTKNNSTISAYTESPFVVNYNGFYYLFMSNSGDRTYDKDYVFKSKSPYYWDDSMKIGELNAHASEVIHTKDDKWYVTHCGWGRSGFYIAPLFFDDE